MIEVYNFLKNTKVYYIATIENNEPKIRPFGTIDLFENALYFQTGKKKKIYKELIINPKFEICAFDGNTWLRLSGTAVEDDRREARKHMLDNYAELRSLYDEDDGNTTVFKIENARAEFCSFTKEPKAIEF